MTKLMQLKLELISNKLKRERTYNVIQSAFVLFAILCGVVAFVYFMIINTKPWK